MKPYPAHVLHYKDYIIYKSNGIYHIYNFNNELIDKVDGNGKNATYIKQYIDETFEEEQHD